MVAIRVAKTGTYGLRGPRGRSLGPFTIVTASQVGHTRAVAQCAVPGAPVDTGHRRLDRQSVRSLC